MNYPGLILKLVLRRKLKYHLIQTYMVSTVFLTISWLALFLPPNSIAERLAIAMTILLTLTSMFASERRSASHQRVGSHPDIIDIDQVSPARVLRDLPGHVDGLLHRLRLPGAGGVQCNLPP